jgi:hypothetical protein
VLIVLKLREIPEAYVKVNDTLRELVSAATV